MEAKYPGLLKACYRELNEISEADEEGERWFTVESFW